jgi:hypothetical protein
VRLEGGGYHRITYIISRDHDDDGFDVRSNWNRLTYNEGNDNGDEGFQVTGSYNYLGLNNARRNGSDGFDLDNEEGGGHNNTLFKNTAEWNNEGFEIGGNNNVLKFNHANYNTQGFLIEAWASGNWLTFNVAFRSEFDGLQHPELQPGRPELGRDRRGGRSQQQPHHRQLLGLQQREGPGRRQSQLRREPVDQQRLQHQQPGLHPLGRARRRPAGKPSPA